MSANNPYDAPKSHVEDVVHDDGAIEQIASGQKLIIYAILLDLVAMVINRSFPGGLVLACVLVSLVLSIIGILRLSNGMGHSTGVKVLLVISLFIPIVSLIVLISLSVSATSRLKAAGYKVGLLGARR